MKNDSITMDVIKMCSVIDRKAAGAYNKIAEVSPKQDLKTFWQERATEEEGHVDYWTRLLNYAKGNSLGYVFAQPYHMKNDLERIASKADSLLLQCRLSSTMSNSLLLAYQLEFFMTHPAFRVLFHLLKELTGEKTPEDDYEHHLNQFVKATGEYGDTAPGFDIVGDAIQRLWKENRKLYILSNTDDLTGILNRRGFSGAVEPLTNLAQRNRFSVGLMMVDIDDFKKVNDTYGHAKGDEIIKIVASALSSRMRSSDIVARYGGEEFIIYLPSAKNDSLYTIADELRKLVESETKQAIPVTISIGVAQKSLKGKENTANLLERLIDKADQSLYQAKDSGKNRVIVSG